MNLYQASSQWSTRPDDERFASLPEMYQAVHAYRMAAREQDVPMRSLAIQERSGEPILVGPNGGGARFTHYAFGQFANRIGAPASYLRSLPAPLAAQLLNHGLDRQPNDTMRVLLHEDGKHLVRAATSDVYARIWNDDLVGWAMHLPPSWRVPPARPARPDQKGTRKATEEDVLEGGKFGLAIRLGDDIAPAGLYASDHDLFVFMVDESRPIDLRNEPMNRGFFLTNSEVGDKTLRLTMFLYSFICGNHIVWGAENVTEFRIRHVGRKAFLELRDAQSSIRRELDRPASADLKLIEAAKGFQLGPAKAQVIDLVYAKRILGRKQAEAAWKLAEEHENVHGDPTSAWGCAAGVTRLAQQSDYADERDEMDRAGRRILEMAF